MPTLQSLVAFFGVAVLLALSPGPDNLFVLMQSVQRGWRVGIAVVVGLCLGVVVHTAAVALGLAAVFAASAMAFTVLKWCGAAYLAYLAWGAWRAPVSTDKSAAGAGGTGATSYQPSSKELLQMVRRGVVMNLTNPKVLVFFLAFLPQFCDPTRGSVAVQVLILGVLFMLATIVVFWTVAALGGRLAVWFNRSPRGQIIMQRVAGCVFVAMAAALLLSSR